MTTERSVNERRFCESGFCTKMVEHTSNLPCRTIQRFLQIVVFLFLVQFAQGNGPGKRISFSIVEEEPKGTFVGNVPTESGYSYIFSEPNDYFHIDSQSGRITTFVKIDREKLSNDVINILILGNPDDPSKSKIPIEASVRVLDINDNSPTFPNPTITISFQEDANKNAQKLIDAATDKDSGPNGTVTNYKIISGNVDNTFTLVELTKSSIFLTLNSALNREDIREYNLTIQVQDSGQPIRYGFLKIRVVVTDINDNPPLFDLSDYTAEVNENVKRNSNITKVGATDADSGLNGKFHYLITDDTGQFTINRDTGVISTIVDRLKCTRTCQSTNGHTCQPRSCFMTVTAKDRGNPSLLGRAYVTVYLLDENDHAPVIKFHHYPDSTKTYSTVEEDAINNVVALVTVSDADYGLNAETHLNISHGNELGHFYMQSRSINLIRVKTRLDRNKINKYNLTLIAYDKGTPPRTSTSYLIIFVKDRDRNAPRFDKDRYHVSLPESTQKGSYVKSITAKDTDGNDSNLKFEIVSGNTNGWFTINENTGLVLTADILDYERNTKIVLNISVRDNVVSAQKNYTSLTIDIIDENDVTPHFTQNPVTISIDEGTGSNKQITSLTATDNEKGAFGSIVYRLTQESKEAYPRLFNVNDLTGAITILQDMDREGNDRFIVKVIASDKGSPSLSATGTLIIQVNDINDNSPVIDQTRYYMTATPSNHRQLKMVQIMASDADIGANGDVTYAITHGDTHLFTIDAISGWISSVDGLSEGNYKLSVVAQDGGNPPKKSATADVFIAIKTDQNVITFSKDYSIDIDEDYKLTRYNIGKSVATISATSKIGSNIKYSIVSGDQLQVFEINSDSGEIKTVKVLDREEKENYALSVVASDGVNYKSTLVKITVKDLNDNTPIFSKMDDYINVNEDWSVGYDIALTNAYDDDIGNNGKISYTASVANDIFTIDQNTGLIRIAKPLSSFVEQEFVMQITASDNGSPKLSSSTSIKISVNDVNDHTPSFSHPNYEMSLEESVEINKKVYKLSATDRDYGLNANVNYMITRGNDGYKFGVFPDGWVYIAESLNREKEDLFMLTILAYDSGSPSCSSSSNLTIYITDVNDNTPQFTDKSYSFTIEENSPDKSFIGTVSATDRDLGKNSDLLFSCDKNSDFTVDPFTGSITTVKSFDREQLIHDTNVDFMHLKITVTDHGVPQLSTEVKVKITVTDINDNGPVFEKDNYHIKVNENSPVNAPVLTVKAIDLDSGANGVVKYSLSHDTFWINENSGDITITSKLDREKTDSYIFNVTATNDANGVNYTVNCTVYITVEDHNDNYPVFTTKINSLDLSEATLTGEYLGQFHADDADLGQNSTVWYSLPEGNEEGYFQMDKFSGKLYLSKRIDYEQRKNFLVNVTASDYGNPALSTSMNLNIRITDVNDNAPVFPNLPLVYYVKEEQRTRSYISQVTAIDADEVSFDKLSYYIARQSPFDGNFEIDEKSGAVYAKPGLDREVTEVFVLTIAVIDKGGSSQRDWKFAQKNVTIKVTDVNDNPPVFLSSSAIGVDIRTSPGIKIGTFEASDRDSGSNGEVAYQLSNGDTNLFRIDSRDGSLYLKSGLSNAPLTQKLSIIARDKGLTDELGQKSATLTATVFIYDGSVSDASFAFTSSLYTGSIRENLATGSTIVTIQTRSTNVEFYVTSITADNSPQLLFFAVDKHTGIITNTQPLDRELYPGPFTLQLVGVDVSGSSKRRMVTEVRITVLDENDSPPYIAGIPAVLRVPEIHPAGRTVATLTASDADTSGQFTFGIAHASHPGVFAVDQRSGEMGTLQKLDHETQWLYRLTLNVSDGIHHSLSPLTIIIGDVNDNSPVFSSSFYVFEFPEDSPRGSIVAAIRATDDDSGENGRVTYKMESVWGADVFSLDHENGTFTVIGNLDYEQVEHYILTITATDHSPVSPRTTTATVYMNVVDVNDNEPVFDPSSYSTRVSESVRQKSRVLTVSATDVDSGINAEIRYSIHSGDPHHQFDLDPISGVVTTVQLLDRETIASYTLVVVATDQSDPPSTRRSTTATVVVTVTDTNDNSPTFTSPTSVKVEENTSLQSPVFTVTADDHDEGLNAEIEFTVDFNTHFYINSTGTVFIKQNVDRETVDRYDITVYATDKGYPRLTSSTTIHIHISDVNDNSPIFTDRHYAKTIPEDTDVGDSLMKFAATDNDIGLNGMIAYYIDTGDDIHDFSLGASSGILRVQKKLDYEEKQSYKITIIAQDYGTPSRQDSITVTITLTDVNDNAPVFYDSPYIAYVQENIHNHPVPMITVTANDSDSALFSKVTYTLHAGVGQKDMFAMDSASGEITVLKTLDREQMSEYQLTVIAKDSGTPPLTGTGTIKVIVQDDNDNTPTFTLPAYNAYVTENDVAAVSLVVVTATDKDTGRNADITYSLLDTHSGTFSVDPTNGSLSTLTSLNRESTAMFDLVVVATDDGLIPRSSLINVTVYVDDVNDNSPIFERTSYVSTVSSLSKDNFVLGVLATDADKGDNGRIQYTMKGPDSGDFFIHPDTGVITARQRIDGGSKTFIVEAADLGSPSYKSSTSVSITILPPSTSPRPQITSHHQTITLAEDTKLGHVIDSVSAHSPKTITYFIAGGNIENVFAIDDKSGVVTLVDYLDYEQVQKYDIYVGVKDTGSPPLFGYQYIRIEITDVNDNAPRFDRQGYYVNMSESSSVFVVKLQASDADSGINGEVEFSIVGGNVNNAFGVDATSGEIRITSQRLIDREKIDRYTLIVMAKDKGSTAQFTQTTVDIKIEDTNDNFPKFTRQFSISIPESAAVGSFVLRVTSSDDDVGRNAIATYSLSTIGNDHSAFAIDAKTGNITVNDALDAETKNRYRLEVFATDGSFRIQTTVTITISDVNDNSPKFNKTKFSFDFEELQAANSQVGRVTAFDRDISSPNNQFYFSLYRSSEMFFITAKTGHVYCRKSLKYLINSSSGNRYELYVVATDHGTPARSSKVKVVVNVVDANDHAPIFETMTYRTSAPVNVNKGKQLVQVVARDEQDFGLNAEVRYAVTGGNGTNIFSVDSLTGFVSVAADLNGRQSRLYRIIITASDRGIKPLAATVTVFILITDVNRYTPQFTISSFLTSLPEDTRVGYQITTFTASDHDTGINGKVAYFITSGNEQRLFDLDQLSGDLTIVNEMDYEISMSHHLMITVRDRALLYKETTRVYTIQVTDVNDNQPIFDMSSYDAYIQENSPIGSFVFKCEATDADSGVNAIIEYEIMSSNGGDNLFSVKQNGDIECNDVLDYEVRQQYSLVISAKNPGSQLKNMMTLKIHVTGINEFLPQFIDNVYFMRISESAKSGTLVGKVHATDADLGPDGIVYYYLVGSSNMKAFKIHHMTGEITVSGKPDYEKSNRISLHVIAKNRGPVTNNNTVECTVHISIEDANDAPQFTATNYNAKVKENSVLGTHVITVSANDNDNIIADRRFSYVIIGGNDDNTFDVDTKSGEITLTGSVDRETVDVYHVIVGAIDSGSPPQTGSATVTVTILDINDNGPFFTTSPLTAYISENRPTDTSVIRLLDYTDDADDVTNGPPFRFYTPNGISYDKFSIDSVTGLVTTKNRLDREESSEYVVPVMVEDNGVPPQKSLLSFRVVVEDVDDSPSFPRVLTVVTTIYNRVVPTEPIADVRPLDSDIRSSHSCDIITGDVNVFAMLSGCELNLINYPTLDDYQLSIRSLGQNANVRYNVAVRFNKVVDPVFDNSVTLRIKSKARDVFLRHNYQIFVDGLNSMLESGYSASIVQLTQNNDDLLVMVSIVNQNSVYLFQKAVENIIKPKLVKLRLLSKCSIEDTPINPCSSNMCKNSAKCTPIFNKFKSLVITDTENLIFTTPKVSLSYKCTCVGSYSGEFCATSTQLCGSRSCKNGGKCEKYGVCKCPQNWKGDVCDVDVDECKTPRCRNSGTCVNLPGSYRCDCVNGFTGNTCEKRYEVLTFTDGAFIESSTLDEKYNNITVRFSTISENALILYNPSETTGDFLALEIVANRIRLSVKTSGASQITRLSVPTELKSSLWYTVTVSRWLQLISLKLESCQSDDVGCTTCMDGDASCHVISVIQSSGLLKVSDSILYIGGLQNITTFTSNSNQLNTYSFIGCMSVSINGYDSVQQARLSGRGVNSGCERSVCAVDACGGHGQCIDEWTFTRCECTGGFKGPNCDKEVEIVTFGSDVTVTYTQRPSYTHKKALSSLRKRRSTTTSHVSMRVAPSVESGVLFYSATDDSYAALVVNGGKLHFITSHLTSDTPTVTTADTPSIQPGTWYNVSVIFDGGVLTLRVDEHTTTNSQAPNTPDFSGDDVTTIVLGGAPHDVTVDGHKLPGYQGCMEDFTLNHKPLPFSGATDRFFIEVSGSSTATCKELLALAGGGTKDGGLSTGVIVVIVLLSILVVVMVIAFILYRKRKNLCMYSAPSGDSRTKLNGNVPFTNGKLPHDIGSRSHDSGYGECNELADELTTQIHDGRSFELARPDIIENDRYITSSLPLEIDDGTVIIENGDMLYPACCGQDYAERYDLDNINTVCHHEGHTGFHDEGPVPSQYYPNMHSPPFYHQLDNQSHRHQSPMTVEGRRSARQSPCVSIPPIHTISHPHSHHPHSHPNSRSTSRPNSRNSPNDPYHQRMPMNQLSKQTVINSRTSPLGLPRNMESSPIETPHRPTPPHKPPHKSRHYSSSDHSLISSNPSNRRPNSRSKHRTNPYSGYKRHPKGLTIEEVDRLNAHRLSQSPISTQDAVSSTSDENTPHNHHHSSHPPTSTATLLEHIESSSDESPNGSFTCSEYDYGHTYDRLQYNRAPGAIIFSKLTEENENDVVFTPNRHTRTNNSDGMDSNGSYSTIPSSEEERTPPTATNDQSAINWDYLLNWGPSFEKLVGVFKDIASLPDDAVQTKVVSPGNDYVPQLEEAYV